MPLTMTSFHSMPSQHTTTSMADKDFYKSIRHYPKSKHVSRRGMRPMRSSTTMTAAQKNRKIYYYSMAKSVTYELGPKKGNHPSTLLFIRICNIYNFPYY
jgi:hypothetical protein